MSALPPPAPDCAACAARDERIAELEDLAGELREAVGAQADQIAALREQVARLERAQSRNSGNSSMPPSSDDVPGRTPPRRQRRAAERAAGKRNRGKQPGAPGAAMRWADPDQTIPHFPEGECACGRDLREARDLGVASSAQQLDIPEPRAKRIQHDMHAARCACGREHIAARPPGVPDAPLSIGPGLRALAVYLLVYQHIPVERCRQLIADVAGAEVSDGFIHSCLRKAASALAGVIKLIKTLITAAHVAGFDETTLRAGKAGTKKYVQGAFTERYTALFLGERTLKSFRKFGILPGFTGITVTDRYVNYWHEDWKHLAGHQACLAHLIRDFTDAAETYPGQIWPEQARRALSGLIKAWHDALAAGQPAIPAGVADPLATEFRRAVTVGLSRVPRVPGPKNTTKQHPGRDLLEFCRDREADVLRFTTDTRIWPTNNISERGVRPEKTQQKISGRLTSEDATQDRLDIRSYIDTARKHGQDVLHVLHRLMRGNPWTPPAPAPA
ncbi:MAG TPA: IS66 family transposase [Streptosporangiaceae bacterium]|nr:IS66 family transposase [Streptosporangiaceae bacterium]